MKLKRFMILTCASCWNEWIQKKRNRREFPKEKYPGRERERGQRGAVSHLGPKKVFKCHPHYFELHSFRLMRGPRLRFEPIQKKRKKKRSKANKTYNNQQQQQTKAPLLSIKIERGLQRVQIIGFRLLGFGIWFDWRKSSKIQIMLI